MNYRMISLYIALSLVFLFSGNNVMANNQNTDRELTEPAIEEIEQSTKSEIQNEQQEVVQLKGQIYWKEAKVELPTSIELSIYKNEDFLQTITVSNPGTDEWDYEFFDLPKYDEEGQLIHYSIEAPKIEGFIAHIEDLSITVTSELKEVKEKMKIAAVETTAIQGEIVWDDYQNKDKIRPDFVEVVLMHNKERVDSKNVEAGEGNQWTFSFDDVPALDENLQKIDYTVDAQDLINYEVKVEGYRIISKLIAEEEVNEPSTADSSESSDEIQASSGTPKSDTSAPKPIEMAKTPTDKVEKVVEIELEELPATGVEKSIWPKIAGGLMIVAALAFFFFFRTKPRKK